MNEFALSSYEFPGLCGFGGRDVRVCESVRVFNLE